MNTGFIMSFLLGFIVRGYVTKIVNCLRREKKNKDQKEK